MHTTRTKRTDPVFRANLARLRKDHGYTLAQVGEAIGVKESAVWKYENSDHWPKPEIIDRIADLYKISVASLFTPGGAEEKAFQLKTTEKEVLDIFLRMIREKRVPKDFWERVADTKEAG